VTAIAVTILATFLGTYLSFFLDSAPAPTIVLVLTGFFLVAFARRLRLTRMASTSVGAGEG
jgi:manganese/iron transport system permease protein